VKKRIFQNSMLTIFPDSLYLSLYWIAPFQSNTYIIYVYHVVDEGTWLYVPKTAFCGGFRYLRKVLLEMRLVNSS